MRIGKYLRILTTLSLLLVAGGTGLASRAVAGDGAQFSRDCTELFVNKKVGDNEQWAIEWNIFGDATGNVLKLDGSPPSFIECIQINETDTDEIFDCYGSSACSGPPCGGSQWTLIASNLTIPMSFFFPPGIDPDNFFSQCTVAGAAQSALSLN
jgi:hypothetical protein